MYLLVVTQTGYGLLTDNEYQVRHRCGIGTRSIATLFTGTRKNGAAVILREVTNLEHDVLVLTASGQVVRFPVNEMRVSRSNTAGIKIISLVGDDYVTDAIICVTNSDAQTL